MDRSSDRGSDVPYIEKQRVGEYEFTLMVPAEEGGEWPWVLNRTNSKAHSTFGRTIASGRATSRKDALRLVNAAFDAEAPKARKVVLQRPRCRVVFEVPRELLEFDKEGRVIDGPGTATCPNKHTFDFSIGSLQQE